MKLERTLKSLAVKGFVQIRKLPGAESDGTGRKLPGVGSDGTGRKLPDKTYIDLVSQNFRYTGRNPTQQKRLKHKKGQKKKEIEEYDGPMYG